jgi:hypothetical protein
MSSALAIAAVTAALKDLLNDGLLNHDLSVVGSFSVTASPPDRVTVGANEPNQLNLFLYQVTANLGWRNAELPSVSSNGARLTNPPLALDLHYMLSAYGSRDLNAEILLGYAMELLHQNPVLTRAQLRTVLGPPSPVGGTILPSPFGNLSAIDLADQVELIKISPVFLSTEDLSKMWTAMQARYRPTMAYLVSVVLIRATEPISAPLPVLKRGHDDRGASATAAAPPILLGARVLASDVLPAMRLGDDILLTGMNLALSNATAVFENERAGMRQPVATSVSSSPLGLIAHVPSIFDDPNAMKNWACGMYSITLLNAQSEVPPTGTAYIVLAPSITVTPRNVAVGDTITLTCGPRLRVDRDPRPHVSVDRDRLPQVSVIFGSRSVVPSITTPSDESQPTTIQFAVPQVAAGPYIVRLRVDGIDSLPITISGSSVDFDVNQRVTVA